MRFIFAALFATLASAHFQLQYPLPRGPFVGNEEPTFCDGYTNAVSNRTVFPISNGVINLKAGHQEWTAGVIISTVQDPTSFSDFKSSSGYQMVVPYFQTSGVGDFCFPIDIESSKVSGIHDGANVTVQVIFNSGDGQLYQCADLTLSAKATLPSGATSGCTNVTASTTATLPAPTAGSDAGRNVVKVASVLAVVLTGFVVFF